MKKAKGGLKAALKAMNVVIVSHMLELKFERNELKNYMTKISALVQVARQDGTVQQ